MIKISYLRWRGRFCPLVEVWIMNEDKTVRTLAYIDTGATYSVFHSDFIEELGLDLLSGERIDITVGDGGMIPVFLFDLKVVIESLELFAKIGSSDRLGMGINILGRESLLDNYMVCFDGINREVIWHV